MIATETSSALFLLFFVVRLRQEEKRQQEETNRVKERKRKREKYAEKVSASGLGWRQGLVGVGAYRRGFGVHDLSSWFLVVIQLQMFVISSSSLLTDV